MMYSVLVIIGYNKIGSQNCLIIAFLILMMIQALKTTTDDLTHKLQITILLSILRPVNIYKEMKTFGGLPNHILQTPGTQGGFRNQLLCRGADAARIRLLRPKETCQNSYLLTDYMFFALTHLEPYHNVVVLYWSPELEVCGYKRTIDHQPIPKNGWRWKQTWLLGMLASGRGYPDDKPQMFLMRLPRPVVWDGENWRPWLRSDIGLESGVKRQEWNVVWRSGSRCQRKRASKTGESLNWKMEHIRGRCNRTRS